jgi:hypothetical protein
LIGEGAAASVFDCTVVCHISAGATSLGNVCCSALERRNELSSLFLVQAALVLSLIVLINTVGGGEIESLGDKEFRSLASAR